MTRWVFSAVFAEAKAWAARSIHDRELVAEGDDFHLSPSAVLAT